MQTKNKECYVRELAEFHGLYLAIQVDITEWCWQSCYSKQNSQTYSVFNFLNEDKSIINLRLDKLRVLYICE